MMRFQYNERVISPFGGTKNLNKNLGCVVNKLLNEPRDLVRDPEDAKMGSNLE